MPFSLRFARKSPGRTMQRLHDELPRKQPEPIAMNQRKLSSRILLSDLLWSMLAMAAALLLRYEVELVHVEVVSASALLPFLAATWIIWTFLFRFLSLDGFRGGWRLSAVVSQLLLSVGALMLILLSCGYLLRTYVSRLGSGSLWFVAFRWIYPHTGCSLSDPANPLQKWRRKPRSYCGAWPLGAGVRTQDSAASRVALPGGGGPGTG